MSALPPSSLKALPPSCTSLMRQCTDDTVLSEIFSVHPSLRPMDAEGAVRSILRSAALGSLEPMARSRAHDDIGKYFSRPAPSVTRVARAVAWLHASLHLCIG